jgi:hypothetical protein
MQYFASFSLWSPKFFLNTRVTEELMTFMWKVTDWINIDEDDVQLRATVKAVMKLRVP